MDKAEMIKKNVDELLKMIGIDAQCEVTNDNNQFMATIKTEVDAPFLIGKYGETLSAMQRVIEAMLYKAYQEPVSVLVNVNDYRERQRERLEGIAENTATRAIAERKTVTLRSFSAFERKIIHEYISTKYPELTTISDGEGIDRKLNISLKGESNQDE